MRIDDTVPRAGAAPAATPTDPRQGQTWLAALERALLDNTRPHGGAGDEEPTSKGDAAREQPAERSAGKMGLGDFAAPAAADRRPTDMPSAPFTVGQEGGAEAVPAQGHGTAVHQPAPPAQDVSALRATEPMNNRAHVAGSAQGGEGTGPSGMLDAEVQHRSTAATTTPRLTPWAGVQAYAEAMAGTAPAAGLAPAADEPLAAQPKAISTASVSPTRPKPMPKPPAEPGGARAERQAAPVYGKRLIQVAGEQELRINVRDASLSLLQQAQVAQALLTEVASSAGRASRVHVNGTLFLQRSESPTAEADGAHRAHPISSKAE